MCLPPANGGAALEPPIHGFGIDGRRCCTSGKDQFEPQEFRTTVIFCQIPAAVQRRRGAEFLTRFRAASLSGHQSARRGVPTFEYTPQGSRVVLARVSRPSERAFCTREGRA